MESAQEVPGIAAKIKNIDGTNRCPLINKNNAGMSTTDSPKSGIVSDAGKQSYAALLQSGTDTAPSSSKLNFRYIEMESNQGGSNQPGVDVVLSRESVRLVQNKLEFTLYGYFLGERIAYPVVDYYVKTNWKKYGLQKSMMNSNGFFFFKFDSEKGMLDVLEGGPWLVRRKPIFLNIWSVSSKLKKDDIKSLAVWVKLHDVPLAAYTEEGLSMLASKIGKPKLLDSYTTSMCLDVWGRSSYARALIEISALHELKSELTIATPQLDSDQYVTDTVFVEYEWSPPRCSHCTVFGHETSDCSKQPKPKQKERVVADEDVFIQAKGRKANKRVGFPVNRQHAKFEYRAVGPKKNASLANKSSVPSTSKPYDSSTNKFTQNSFADLSYLNDDDTLSDDEEVIEEINDTKKFMASGTNSSAKGANTSFSKGFYGKL